MNLKKADSELEKLDNELECLIELKFNELMKTTPKPVDLTKERTKGGTREDKFLKYVSKITSYDKRINEINDEMFVLQEYVESELKRLNKYDELTQQIVYYKERYIPEDHKQLTWEDIAKKVHSSRGTCRRLYRFWRKERNV